MKSILFVFALLSVTARADFVCNEGNGSYRIAFSPTVSSALLTRVSASGVEDEQGRLACQGLQESAFVCEGVLRALDARTLKFTGPARHVTLVAPESGLQGGIGTFTIDNVFVRCSEK
jgi:hypothetical protein